LSEITIVRDSGLEYESTAMLIWILLAPASIALAIASKYTSSNDEEDG